MSIIFKIKIMLTFFVVYLLGFVATAIIIRKDVVNDEQQVALSLLWPALVLLLVCTLPHQIVTLINFISDRIGKK